MSFVQENVALYCLMNFRQKLQFNVTSNNKDEGIFKVSIKSL